MQICLLTLVSSACAVLGITILISQFLFCGVL